MHFPREILEIILRIKWFNARKCYLVKNLKFPKSTQLTSFNEYFDDYKYTIKGKYIELLWDITYNKNNKKYRCLTFEIESKDKLRIHKLINI